MMNLKQVVKGAEKNKIAVGHFNISNLEQLKAITEAAKKLAVPVVVGVSEGERDFIGVHHAVDLIKSYNREHSLNTGKPDFPRGSTSQTLKKIREEVEPHNINLQKLSGYYLFLNADHTHSLENVKIVAEAGHDALRFDGWKLAL